MTGSFSRDKIDEVREATDIVDLISNYLTLKKAGKSFVGLCPFHTDSSPSFHVNPNNQLYYCFGCQKGGNVFNFLMEVEKMSFREALEFLAEKANIPLPSSQADNALEKEKEGLYHVNRWAANFFYKNLFTPKGKLGLQYIKDRSISDEMIKKFGLGYSLPGWDSLVNQARHDSISLELLTKSGLIIKKSGDKYYDRFRGRFMIPVSNLYKKVIGFGGRIIVADEKQPKYINSPESPIYHKGSVLFGLYQSRQKIRELDQAIFVEGYTDLISLFQAGIKNVVATSGTALTPNQAKLIRRFSENIILLYDADNAGSMAAMRGADIFLDENLEVSIVTLPRGDDPDSYVHKYGKEKFKALLEHGFSLIQFKINTLTKQYDRQTNSGKTKIINNLLTSIARIKNSLKQNLAIKEVAEYFSLDERALMQQMENIKRSDRISYQEAKSERTKKETPLRIQTKYDVAEEDLLKLVIENGSWLPKIFKYLQLDDFKNNELKHLLSIILGIYQQNGNYDKQIITRNITDPDISSKIAGLMAQKIGKATDREQLFRDCIVFLKKRKLENMLHNLTQEIKIAQDKEIDATEYIKKYQDCQKEKRKVEDRTFFED
ncbi:DNA primase [candidate division KSB1 bacterium 4572_119]|nr:MAG: DNA primase [candidate division KSB1 bacterium 4572_119]